MRVRFFFSCVCLSSLHTYDVLRNQKRAADPLIWSQRRLGPTVLILGTEPRLSGRATNAFNHSFIPPASVFDHFFTTKKIQIDDKEVCVVIFKWHTSQKKMAFDGWGNRSSVDLSNLSVVMQ